MQCMAMRMTCIETCAGLGAAARWKAGMLRRAGALFSRRGADLQSYIYGTSALADGPSSTVQVCSRHPALDPRRCSVR